MTNSPFGLVWLADSVANVMHRKGIKDRKHLAEVTELAHSTIYSTFDEDWSGQATTGVLARVAAVLNVPLNELVVEPAVQQRRLRRVEEVETDKLEKVTCTPAPVRGRRR